LARLVDSHAHLDDEGYREDLPEAIDRARAAGVSRIVCIGLWRAPGSFGNALELATSDPGTFSATAGVHPHECARVPEADWGRLAELSRDPRIVAVGETGLDFHYDHSPRPAQLECFRRSIRLARDAGKPVVVHVREADDACAEVLASEGVPPAGGVIHCFTGDGTAARRYLDLGLHISVAGVVTFKTADGLRQAVKLVPRDRLLIETDSPYLAPVPHRGKRNEPAFVVRTAEKVAELWGASLDAVGEATSQNARRLFRLP
jgi:TatD DNase family protein